MQAITTPAANPSLGREPGTAPDRLRVDGAVIRVLVVDDHPAVRAGIESVVATEDDLECIDSVGGADEALRAAEVLQPDVAVLDYQLGSHDGLTITRQLKALPSPPRVLMYSAYADSTLAVMAVVAGADGLLSKATRGNDLCDAIRSIAAGRSVMPKIAAGTLRAVGRELDTDDLAILGMLIHGTPPAEIASVLGLSERWLDARRWAMVRRVSERLIPRGTVRRGQSPR
jgi:DNA-binding NarL/FixJ family response regulator